MDKHLARLKFVVGDRLRKRHVALARLWDFLWTRSHMFVGGHDRFRWMMFLAVRRSIEFILLK